MQDFSDIPESDFIASNDLAFAFFDRFPVSKGHALVVTRRVIGTWWEANPEEHAAVFALVRFVRDKIDGLHSPAGYNIGFNDGEAAGQTIPHLHVHVIPRYRGDVPDPTGGVRGVIPRQANYLESSTATSDRALVTPENGQLLTHLRSALTDTRFDHVDFVVSFVMLSGVRLILDHLDDAVRRGVRVRILATDYLTISQPAALALLLERISHPTGPGSLQIRIHQSGQRSFHPKAYIFTRSADGTGRAVVGSSNLSRSGIQTGIEWNLRTEGVGELVEEFNLLWDHPASAPLDQDWLLEYDDRYRQRRQALADAGSPMPSADGVSGDDEGPPEPWELQRDALGALESTRIAGHRAGLVVMATGLGKTWLAAFDSTRPQFRRVLFIAHRDEILQQSRDVYRQVRPGDTLTMFTGRERDPGGRVVFASIQMLTGHLDEFAPDAFDYIVVDEFHHAAAPTYRAVINHFTPTFLLGLTATPERADAADLLALCHDNLVYECGLATGIAEQYLVSFEYRAIRDVAEYENIPWRGGKFDVEELSRRLETVQRADQALHEWRQAGGPERHTLGFCCTIAHADFMAHHFRASGIRAVAVHSGPTSADRRESIDRLTNGELDVIFTVDLFNEGLDVPVLDLVLLLRPTESPVVFFQQIGRGLRICDGKDRLRVVDLVANHRSSFLKARLLCQLAGEPDLTSAQAIERLRRPLTDLPPGCDIFVDTELIDDLSRILRPPGNEMLIEAFIEDWVESHDGERPTAIQAAILLRRSLDLKRLGGWFGLLDRLGHLSVSEMAVTESFRDFLLELEYGSYQKSFKLVCLLALLDHGTLAEGMPVEFLAERCRAMIFDDPRLLMDLNDATSAFRKVRNPTDAEWLRYWEKNPIAAWTGIHTRGSERWFTAEDGTFRFATPIDNSIRPTFDAMTREVVTYRLHRYLITRKDDAGAVRKPVADDGTAIDATFKVQDLLGKPSSVFFFSAGGAGKASGTTNPDYVPGVDTVLTRLQAVGAVLLDAFVDSTKVQHLPVPARRLNPGAEDQYPVQLQQIARLEDIRKSLLRSMREIGRAPGAKKAGGNNRKAMRFILGGVPDVPAEAFADYLAGTLSLADLAMLARTTATVTA